MFKDTPGQLQENKSISLTNVKAIRRGVDSDPLALGKVCVMHVYCSTGKRPYFYVDTYVCICVHVGVSVYWLCVYVTNLSFGVCYIVFGVLICSLFFV